MRPLRLMAFLQLFDSSDIRFGLVYRFIKRHLHRNGNVFGLQLTGLLFGEGGTKNTMMRLRILFAPWNVLLVSGFRTEPRRDGIDRV